MITSSSPPRELVRLPAGTRLGRYQILSAIGADSASEVYRAQDTRHGRLVTVKIISKALILDEPRRAQFDYEVQAVSAVRHPHTCALLDADSAHGVPFLVMECLDGETLKVRLSRGALSPEDCVRFAMQLTEAVGAIHRVRIIHCNLTPANVMLTASGVKLLNAGLATLAPSADELVTTPTVELEDALPYMAPEQLRADGLGFAVDLYAIGAVLYEMAGGMRAFAGKSIESLMSAILNAPPAPLRLVRDGVPPGVECIIHKCLSKRPHDRPLSACALLEDLRRLTLSDGISNHPKASSPRPG